MSEPSVWECPGCGRKFRLPVGKKPPRQCQTCQQATDPPAPVIDESSFLADLAAAAPRPAPPLAPAPVDPGPAPGFVKIVPAEIVREEDLKGAIRRDKLRRRLIVGGIITTAASLLIGLGFFLASYFSGPYRMPQHLIYDKVLIALRSVPDAEDFRISLTDPKIERDVAQIDGKWLTIVHGTLGMSHATGMKMEMPWSGLVSVDHANQSIEFELKAAGTDVGWTSDWVMKVAEEPTGADLIRPLFQRVKSHGKEPIK